MQDNKILFQSSLIEKKADGQINRRHFFNRIINAAIGLWAAGATAGSGYTLFKYIWPTEKTIGGTTGKKVNFPISEITEGRMKRIVIEGKPVGIILSEGKFYALSLVCTHLGCIVNWEPGKGLLICPCHASSFDLKGNIRGGPAPSPIPTYGIKISENTVIVG